jgi:excisionase family DNA binding protein
VTQPLVSDQAVIAYAGRVLGEFRRRCWRNGQAIPLELEALHAFLNATDRQTPPSFADAISTSDALVVKYSEAAKRLSVSLRGLQRLVSSGELPSVVVAGCRRITVRDLEAFVEGLDRRRERTSA